MFDCEIFIVNKHLVFNVTFIFYVFYIMNYTIEKISWIGCVFVPIEWVDCVTVSVMVRAWTENENKEENGIAHCLEHMLFKGGKKYVWERELFKATDSIWAKLNWSTGMDTVRFFIDAAPEFIWKAIDVLSDMIVNSEFREDDLEREKKVIVQEIRRRGDNPRIFAFDQNRIWYVWDNSFWRPFTWIEENVMSLSVKDLQRYKDSLYTKDNLIIVIAWKNADSDFVKEQINLNFSALRDKRGFAIPKYIGKKPEERVKMINKWLKQAQLIMSLKWFAGIDKSIYAADILMSLLWWMRSSLLKYVIREQESLCYDLLCDQSCFSDFWYFTIATWLDKNRLEYWLDKINEVVWTIEKWNITEEMFNNAVWFNIWNYKLNMQTPSSISKSVWRHYLLYNEVETIDDVVNHYKSVTLDDVKNMCWMLSPKNWYTLCVK